MSAVDTCKVSFSLFVSVNLIVDRTVCLLTALSAALSTLGFVVLPQSCQSVTWFVCLVVFVWLFKLVFLTAPWVSSADPSVYSLTLVPLISSELLSMPPVKRFSVSFARHPTNGMSAPPPVWTLLPCSCCMMV